MCFLKFIFAPSDDFDDFKTKWFGRKSLKEIKEFLAEMRLTLGMNLEGFEVK